MPPGAELARQEELERLNGLEYYKINKKAKEMSAQDDEEEDVEDDELGRG